MVLLRERCFNDANLSFLTDLVASTLVLRHLISKSNSLGSLRGGSTIVVSRIDR